jgi:hypothetical protein
MSVTVQQVADELDGIASADEFESRAYELRDAWVAAGAEVEVVEPILRFIEAHPRIDFGSPGPLVHFVERFYRKGYEAKLVESFERKPTAHTAWMLNRVINGAELPEERQRFVATMERGRTNPLADERAQLEIADFLERLSRSDAG